LRAFLFRAFLWRIIVVQALNKSGQIKSLSFTSGQFKSVVSGDEKSRILALKELLDYPIALRDRSGSRFWFLRPGESHSAAEETQPIAVGFYSELNSKGDREIKTFLTSEEQQQEIYGHYVDRVNEDQPVMYILLPSGEQTGRVALVLPTEGKLRQRQIQTFEWNSTQLLNSRLPRLHQDSLPIADKALVSTPLVEWVFYDSVATAKELAQRLAEVTRQIEKVIPDVYAAESSNGYLHQLLTSFQKELLPNLKVSSTDEKEYSFADIYAQTVAYGLFTARIFSYERNKDDLISTEFNRLTAWKLLPETNPFLRRLFQDISERSPQELGDELIEAIVEIISYLRVAKMEVILRDFHQKINQEDIVIRFYEDFLAAYKPQMRERRGVYYTPEPVVSYMVRSVDELLKDKFNKPLGIADPEVMILDPACGTGTFLLWIFQLIHKRFQESPEALTEGLEDKSWSGYVKERLLPRVFGFELLMAPYAIAHLKLGLFLEETGYQFDSGKRLGVYLTNALEEATRKSEVLFEEFIAEESNQAATIKQNEPIMVVVGNPPYSIHSQNLSSKVRTLVDEYRFVDGLPIKEKGALQFEKNIQNDYIKFIRFSQSKISQTGHGILAFITDNGYLDNPTFRGMRQNLMNSFDEIFLINLHGNSKRNEKNPSGGKEENVFDIQQGVSISFLVKTDDQRNSLKIKYSEVWGTREQKYSWLHQQDLKAINLKLLNPTSSSYLFKPEDTALKAEYCEGWSLPEVMLQNSAGVITARDHFVIDFSVTPVLERAKFFRDSLLTDSDLCNSLDIALKKGWDVTKARRSIKQEINLNAHIQTIAYRPFDSRYIFYHPSLVWGMAFPTMRHMISSEDNLSLVTTRQTKEDFGVLVSNKLSAHKLVSVYDTNSIFPLYLYPETNAERQMSVSQRPNLSPAFLKDITARLGYTPAPETIFYYIYAVLHSPTYRDRYAEFLKIDFPRVPLTSNDKLFRQLADYGEQLVQLHLMTSPKLDNLITEFVEGTGEHTVAKGHPKYQNGAVIINKSGDKFVGVPEEVWNFYVGGYQPCQKWLKDRKGRVLSSEDIAHYQRIVSALGETIEVMQAIDSAIPGFPIQ
jgi:type I restriction-modification system DNA methylase subunit